MADALRDKSIVIVGGTTGIGLSAARAIAAEGAKLVIVGRDDDGLSAALSDLRQTVLVPAESAVGFAADAADPDTAVRAVELAVATFGRLDGLYHVAGGSGRRFGDGPLHDVTDDGWRQTLDLNLSSVFYSNRAAVRQFLKQATGDERAAAADDGLAVGGSVLNVGSVIARSPSTAHFATHAYAAAKGAIESFTRGCAAYYAKDAVRFNVLAPGLVDTPMARRAAADPAIVAFARRKQPLDGGRLGRPDDLAAAAVYFLSDASRFVTGQVLSVDGGWGVSDG